MENLEPMQPPAERPVPEPTLPPPHAPPPVDLAAVVAGRRQSMAFMASGVALVSAAVLGLVLIKEHRALTALQAEASKETNLAERTRTAFKAALDASEQRNKTANAELASAKTDRQAARDLAVLLSDPASKVVPFAAAQAGGYRGTVVSNAASHRIVVSVAGLRAVPHIDYELWLVTGTQPARAAGLLKPGLDDFVSASVDPRLLTAGLPETVAISVEPAGGKATPSRLILIGRIAPE